MAAVHAAPAVRSRALQAHLHFPPPLCTVGHEYMNITEECASGMDLRDYICAHAATSVGISDITRAALAHTKVSDASIFLRFEQSGVVTDTNVAQIGCMFPNLVGLVLANQYVGAAGMSAFKGLKSFEYFDYAFPDKAARARIFGGAHSDASTESVAAITEAIAGAIVSSMHRLLFLLLESVPLSDAALSALGALAELKVLCITPHDLAAGRLTEAGAAAFFKKAHNLHNFEYSGGGLGPDVIQQFQLAPALRGVALRATLDISDTTQGNQVADALSACKHLVRLALPQCNLPSESWTALLRQLPALDEFIAWRSNLDDNAVMVGICATPAARIRKLSLGRLRRALLTVTILRLLKLPGLDNLIFTANTPDYNFMHDSPPPSLHGIEIWDDAGQRRTLRRRPFKVPALDLLVRLRVLCQAGRACAAGGHSATVAWVCETAPLWLVVQVCVLLRDA